MESIYRCKYAYKYYDVLFYYAELNNILLVVSVSLTKYPLPIYIYIYARLGKVQILFAFCFQWKPRNQRKEMP